LDDRPVDGGSQPSLQPAQSQLPARDVRRAPRLRHGQPAQPARLLSSSQPVLQPVRRTTRVDLAQVSVAPDRDVAGQSCSTYAAPASWALLSFGSLSMPGAALSSPLAPTARMEPSR